MVAQKKVDVEAKKKKAMDIDYPIQEKGDHQKKEMGGHCDQKDYDRQSGHPIPNKGNCPAYGQSFTLASLFASQQ